MESLEDVEDVMGGISIEDITNNLPNAARAVEFESTEGGNELVKKTKEQPNLQGKIGEYLKEAKREQAKQRRKYRARRIIQEMQEVTNKHAGCQATFCEKEREENK